MPRFFDQSIRLGLPLYPGSWSCFSIPAIRSVKDSTYKLVRNRDARADGAFEHHFARDAGARQTLPRERPLHLRALERLLHQSTVMQSLRMSCARPLRLSIRVSRSFAVNFEVLLTYFGSFTLNLEDFPLYFFWSDFEGFAADLGCLPLRGFGSKDPKVPPFTHTGLQPGVSLAINAETVSNGFPGWPPT